HRPAAQDPVRAGGSGQARPRRRGPLGNRRARPGSGLARIVARGAAHLRLLRVDRRVRADRENRLGWGMRPVARAQRLSVVELGHPGRSDQAVPAHRDRPGVRRRSPRRRAVSRGGRRTRAATAGGQIKMIRINLAPERGRRRGAGFAGFKGIRLGLPAFNLGWLFGVVYLALLLGIGVYWWVLTAMQASLTAHIYRAQKDLPLLKPPNGPESK